MILDFSEYSFTNYLEAGSWSTASHSNISNKRIQWYCTYICRAMKSRKDDVAGNDFLCGLPGYRRSRILMNFITAGGDQTRTLWQVTGSSKDVWGGYSMIPEIWVELLEQWGRIFQTLQGHFGRNIPFGKRESGTCQPCWYDSWDRFVEWGKKEFSIVHVSTPW